MAGIPPQLKGYVKGIILGSATIVATPLLAGFIPSVKVLETQIPAANISLMTALLAGVVVFGGTVLLEKVKALN